VCGVVYPGNIEQLGKYWDDIIWLGPWDCFSDPILGKRLLYDVDESMLSQ